MIGSGLIPAHAGKTPINAPDRPSARAHPRSRGENESRSRAGLMTRGSSPLTRGKRRRRASPTGGRRLIPAHAGKTRRRRRVRRGRRAHPRSRGENCIVALPESEISGSSPLTRGKQAAEICFQLLKGLIPAHAGKTQTSPSLTSEAGAHPRSRGENSLIHRRCRPASGSSPLTRGKPCHQGEECAACGLIPAHAGKTRSRIYSGRSAWAHPRSRGENHRQAVPAPNFLGSSPLTRGKQRPGVWPRPVDGLIPAHAGKTSRCEQPRPTPGAHPRSRGENIVQTARDVEKTGSSPLTRGKPARPGTSTSARRLIPAHAGKTFSR